MAMDGLEGLAASHAARHCAMLAELSGVNIVPPSATSVEAAVVAAVQWLRLGVESIGAVVITIGIVSAAVAFVRHISPRVDGSRLQSSRRILAHYLAIALEFQLAADILSTAVAPSWEQIGKLAAIATIRTALNYFLSREMRDATATVSA